MSSWTRDGGQERSIRFEPVEDHHGPLLRRWLAETHVRRWWGDPETEIELILTGRQTGTADGYIAHVDDTPVAYIQSWRPADFDSEPWLKTLPEDVIGIDLFIGRPDMIARGLGPRIIRAFAAKLFANGASRLLIDPDGANSQAIRAYEKAGFTRFSEHRDAEGVTVLMALSVQDFEPAP